MSVTPDSAEEAFTAWLTVKGLDVRHLAPAQGVSEMLKFYCGIRAEGCTSADGDMLLFQWGTYDWGAGLHFEVDITRQFIAVHLEDDDAISQLHLTYRYLPIPVLNECGSGNRWCKAMAEIANFEAYLATQPALRAVAHVEPLEVALTYDYV